MNPSATPEIILSLEKKSRQIRYSVIEMIAAANSGHPGSSLSAVDIIACLYFHQMKHDPGNPDWKERDRFVLSKGHGAPALYATLAEAAYFPREELKSLRKLGSRLQGHPDMKKLPGIEISTGSLGQGLSVANGMAIGARLDHRNSHFYVLMGDGELEEGEIWEAAMTSAHYRLDHLTAIIDRNRLQIDGETEKVKGLEPLADKFMAFGWRVLEIDGHDLRQILDALSHREKGKPIMVIARTVKGKGVSFMENKVEFHGKPPTPDETVKALQELGA